jgi:hypothetical protein
MVISMICHLAGIAWFVRDGDVLAVQLHPRAPAPPAPLPLDGEPVDVVLLDATEPAPAAPHVAPPATAAIARASTNRRDISRSPAAREAAISLGTVPPREPSGAPGADQPAGTPSRGLRMRGSEPAEVPGARLSADFIQRFLDASKPLEPAPDIPGERIGNAIKDLRRRMRTAHPDEVEVLRAQVMALTAERDAEELRAAGRGTYQATKETFTAKVDADGSVHLEDRRENLDSQDKFMLGKGIDPYARDKLGLLDRTRDQRVAIGQRHRREQLGHATELMQRNIDRLWASTTDLAARKNGLFQLWDECAEAGSEDLVTAGTAARALVLGAIRGRLSGANAYTAAELAQLNAHRHSTAAFAPYE